MRIWSLVTYRESGGSGDLAGVLRADGAVVRPDALVPFAGLRPLLDHWTELAEVLRALQVDDLPVVHGAELVAPVRFPNKLLCSGANYVDHMREMGTTEIPSGVTPFFFLVPATTTMIGPGAAIEIPAEPDAKPDWEVELAVVIGRRGRDIDPEQALEHVAGYACFNDVSARGWHRKSVALADPFVWDFLAGKGVDTFCPMGPVTPAWSVADPDDLGLRCTVNGVRKQDGSTRTMIVGVRELIAAASRLHTLEPGDVIATGTPAGAGAGRGEQLVDGDEVLIEIDGLVPLRNPVRVRTNVGVPA